MSDFSIKSDKLIDYTLSLQKINDVALPFALQNALNGVAKDVKKRTLMDSVNKEFNVKKKGFFTANSAYKPYKAKSVNYNINKLKSEIGITKGRKANERATEQIGHQETGTAIKRGINPLGDKPQTKKIIDILSHKPEVITYSNYDDANDNAFKYIRSASRAKKRNAGLLIKSQSMGTGTVYQVRQFKKRKPTPNNPKKAIIKLKQIASYHSGGTVKLKKQRPFLSNAAIKSTKEVLNSEFIKEAEKQIERAWKR
jgi:hypothetical protein